MLKQILQNIRLRRSPKRLDKNAETTAILDLYQFFQKEFKCILDVLVSQLREKMQPTLGIIAPSSCILQCPLHEALLADIKAVAEMMPGNVDSEVLAAELEVFANILSKSQVRTN